jgi:hypothetical protein
MFRAHQIALTLTAFTLVAVGNHAAGAATQTPLALALQWRQNAGNSLAYRVDLETGQMSFLGDTGYRYLNSLARSPDNQYFSFGFSSSGVHGFVRLDPNTGAADRFTPVQPPFHTINGLVALAISPSGVAYGIPAGSPTVFPRLMTFDLETGAASLIGNTSHGSIAGLAFSPTGELFGWSVFGLLRIDPATGVSTRFTPGLANEYIASLDFAPSGALYGIGGATFAIDANSGVTTLLNPLPDFTDIRGMAFIIPEPAAGIPLATAAVAFGRRRDRRWMPKTRRRSASRIRLR